MASKKCVCVGWGFGGGQVVMLGGLALPKSGVAGGSPFTYAPVTNHKSVYKLSKLLILPGLQDIVI